MVFGGLYGTLLSDYSMAALQAPRLYSFPYSKCDTDYFLHCKKYTGYVEDASCLNL